MMDAMATLRAKRRAVSQKMPRADCRAVKKGLSAMMATLSRRGGCLRTSE